MKISTWIYTILWNFWDWKTLFAMKIILDFLKNVEKNKNTLIFTNIKVNVKSDNIIYFEDMYIDKETWKERFYLEDIFYLIDAIKQKEENVPRNLKTRFLIVYDECWIIFNSQQWSKLPLSFKDFMLQIRKYNTTFFAIAQNFDNIVKVLRQNIHYAFKFQKFKFFTFLNNYISHVIFQQIDENWECKLDSYIWKDQKGDYIKKEVPLQWSYMYFFRKPIFDKYDDLFLNKKDFLKDHNQNDIFKKGMDYYNNVTVPYKLSKLKKDTI